MQNEISVTPLVDILSEQLNKRVVANGSVYVYFESKASVKQSDVDTATAKQSELYIKDLYVAKLSKLETAYNNANELDIAYMSTTFQADKNSQNLIVSVLSAGSVPKGFFWIDKVNTQIAMTYSQLQGLSGAILGRNQTNFIKFQDLKVKVNLAKKQADLDLIVW